MKKYSSDVFIIDTSKMSKFKEILISQLQEYTRTGNRLYNIEEAGLIAGIKTDVTARKYAKVILEDMFKSISKGQTVYNLIFGKPSISYHEVRSRCEQTRVILLTSPLEWFNLIQERGDNKGNWNIKVEIEYRDCGHRTFKSIDHIGKKDCYQCMIDNFKTGPLDHDDAIKLAEDRNLELVSFIDPNKPLSRSEFNHILNSFKEQHKNIPQDKFGAKSNNIILNWKCKDCGYIFKNSYYNIRRANTDKFCSSCQASVDQSITQTVAKNIFYKYVSLGDLQVDIPLRSIVPQKYFQKSNYNVICHPAVHLDLFMVLNIEGRKIKLAIEHQGPQHNPNPKIGYEAYKAMSMGKGTYDDWLRLLERDKAKAALFKELEEDDFYLIVVDYIIPPQKRSEYIVSNFESRTGIKIKN